MTASELGPVSGFVVGLLGAGTIEYIGIVGVFFYIGSYLALQLSLVRGDGYLYPTLNLIGSGSVLISLSTHFNPFSAFIESAWVTISLIGIARHWIVTRFMRLTPEEKRVADILLPGLKADRAKRFLRLGRFLDAAPGTRIADEGRALRDLSLLIHGHCRIERRGQTVAILRDGALVGELTYATGAPATATVVVAEPTRFFQIDCVALRAYLARNPDVSAVMESAMTGDLRGKLAEATRRLSEGAPG
ncbi:MAG: Crp/Fnr family transcriptional regulator [Paracoccaceae bacterium]